MAGPRTYVGSLTMHFGPATVRGRLTPIQNSSADEDTKTKFCTPDGNPVHRVYRDDEGNIYTEDELGKATVDEDGVYHLVSKEALEQAKGSQLPNNVFMLSVHRKRDTERWLWPSKHSSYVFEPVIKENKKIVDDPQNIEWYNFLREVVMHPEVDLLTYACMHGNEGLFKLSMYKGFIAVQRQLFPEQLWQTYEEYSTPMDDRTRTLAHTVAERLIQPFETEAYKNQTADRIRAALSEDFDSEEFKALTEAKPAEIDLAAQLEAFLAGQQ